MKIARGLAVAAITVAVLAPAVPAAAADNSRDSARMTDPVAAVSCLAQGAGDVTTLVDPAGLGVPEEIPGASCLAP